MKTIANMIQTICIVGILFADELANIIGDMYHDLRDRWRHRHDAL